MKWLNFITEALRERLEEKETLAVLEETAGIWTDEDYPEFATDEDIDRWLRSSAPVGPFGHFPRRKMLTPEHLLNTDVDRFQPPQLLVSDCSRYSLIVT